MSGRLSKITDLIVRLAQGDLSARAEPTWEDEEFDAVVMGLNMLAEQLERSLRDVHRLDQLANRDELTGLANRRALEKAFDSWASAQNGDSQSLIALAYLDLDEFKPINDRYGHDAGDQLLRVVANRLRALVRTEDLAARIGGDEFAILMRVPSETVAMQVLSRASDGLVLPIGVRGCGEQLSVSASSGLALHPVDGADFAALLSHADKRMYAAKRSGDL